MTHSTIFFAALEQQPPAAPRLRQLERQLVELLRTAGAAWPDCSVEPRLFVEHLARSVAGAEDLQAALDGLQAADLYLACACGHGDPAAVAALEQQVIPAVDVALARLKLQPAAQQEAKQVLRQHLLVAREERPPAIHGYAGRGPLKAWVKVAAVRIALKALQHGKKEVPVEQQVLQALPLPSRDPELHYLQEHYREAFKVALLQALAGLDTRQTNLIRQHYLDGLTTYQLGALYRVHQATAARWLERARQTILSGTRQGLMRHLEVDRDEYESIMRLIHSHLDVTLRSFLIK